MYTWYDTSGTQNTSPVDSVLLISLTLVAWAPRKTTHSSSTPSSEKYRVPETTASWPLGWLYITERTLRQYDMLMELFRISKCSKFVASKEISRTSTAFEEKNKNLVVPYFTCGLNVCHPLTSTRGECLELCKRANCCNSLLSAKSKTNKQETYKKICKNPNLTEQQVSLLSKCMEM